MNFYHVKTLKLLKAENVDRWEAIVDLLFKEKEKNSAIRMWYRGAAEGGGVGKGRGPKTLGEIFWESSKYSQRHFWRHRRRHVNFERTTFYRKDQYSRRKSKNFS